MRLTEIGSDRLSLQPLAASHAASLFPLFDNWKVVRWLSGPPWPYSADLFNEWAGRAMRAQEEDREANAVIIVNGAAVGVVTINWRLGARNIGYWLGEPHWGRGFMSEAAHALLRWFFSTHGDLFVISGAFEGNSGSLRIQNKLGFAQVGETMMHSNPHGRRLGHVDTILGREAWRKRLGGSAAAVG